MTDRKEPLAYGFGKAAAGTFFGGLVKPNAGSAFYGSKPDPSQKLTEEELRLPSDQEFMRAVRIIAEPDMIVVTRLGGGSTAISEIRLHHKKNEGHYLAATTETEDDTYTVMLYENIQEFLAWWSERFAGNTLETTANYIPPTVTLEEFLFILHAIDSFRMVTFKNMLDYRTTDKPYIKYSNFARSMAESIQSGDTRWLLPAFVAVLPGFTRYHTDIKPENVAVLFAQHFLENAKHTMENEDVLIFGEAGQMMGVEFYRSWLFASGFEIQVAQTGGFESVERLFIAPTALANHFVWMEADAEGRGLVNHQAYTREQLDYKLNEIFQQYIS